MAIPYLTSATLPYGSRSVTIGAVAYIANNFTINQSINVIERKGTTGEPNGAVGIPVPKTGTAQLQIATTSTVMPSAGSELFENGVTFFITDMGLPEESGSFKVIDISFRESV